MELWEDKKKKEDVIDMVESIWYENEKEKWYVDSLY